MVGKLAGLQRRLQKVEKALADTAEQQRLADCICRIGPKSAPTIAYSTQAEKFEAEMNQKCPVHGFRDLGPIIAIRITDEPGERFRLDDLLDEYKARESEYRRAKLEHDHQEA
jgi:hypothetical protein